MKKTTKSITGFTQLGPSDRPQRKRIAALFVLALLLPSGYGGSNIVTYTYDAAGNLTGTTVTVVVPTLLSAASRRTHGSAGTFDLALSSAPTNPTTEPRIGPAQTIVFTFDKSINGATATVIAGGATAGAPTFSGAAVLVNLTGVTDQQYVTVALTNVTAVDGSTGGSATVRIGFLATDVSQNRVVTLTDLMLVNAQIAQFVTASNYLMDVNANGALTFGDYAIVNANLSHMLSAP